MSTRTHTAEQQATIDNFRYRFESEAYCKAIEWLAGDELKESAELSAQSCSEFERFVEGATEAVAAMFGQSFNTVYNDAWFYRTNGGAFRIVK